MVKNRLSTDLNNLHKAEVAFENAIPLLLSSQVHIVLTTQTNAYAYANASSVKKFDPAVQSQLDAANQAFLLNPTIVKFNNQVPLATSDVGSIETVEALFESSIPSLLVTETKDLVQSQQGLNTAVLSALQNPSSPFPDLYAPLTKTIPEMAPSSL